MNDQRKVIYEQRADIMDADTVGEVVTDMRARDGQFDRRRGVPAQQLSRAVGRRRAQGEGLVDARRSTRRSTTGSASRKRSSPRWSRSASARRPTSMSTPRRPSSIRRPGRSIEKSILLQNLDHHWKEHLAMLDALRQVVHLRAYAQKTPINEYKHEAFAMFERMLDQHPRGRDPHAGLRAVPHGAAAGSARAARLPDHAHRSADRAGQ